MPLLTYFLWLLCHKSRPRGLQPTITLWPLQQDCQGENVHLQEVIRGRQAVFILWSPWALHFCARPEIYTVPRWKGFLKSPNTFQL